MGAGSGANTDLTSGHKHHMARGGVWPRIGCSQRPGSARGCGGAMEGCGAVRGAAVSPLSPGSWRRQRREGRGSEKVYVLRLVLPVEAARLPACMVRAF